MGAMRADAKKCLDASRRSKKNLDFAANIVKRASAVELSKRVFRAVDDAYHATAVSVIASDLSHRVVHGHHFVAAEKVQCILWVELHALPNKSR